ncbi:MAG: undecaprenyl-diphosphate phosphatase [Desulfobacula sp.]|jgi:undecaprenyl-diphosphatase|uniref:undecaprenyl-diphosphate phosphatase n=1 Tax=Desulfobacula sp. TaxID=2593537 RepID=UPI001D923931|nr:undecaprenyl-diphosphate phosphatase [Desulfobacula sp.]MBT3486337.1 undecaprenyl-diphosphate phosphatase [Desulfobacula sp.]MBT3805894.1 undecaprenyl-diphosphate phosphatase [Desulfobacula sp.]MBT4026320.1 undecaprenyl-diphosphate phosphatase [Desulfobacula sp.]MBT4198062.1 undecaprenyl-diphosphate phosphatase [Desulfobacula sp.]
MELYQGIILGIIQGLTEFLPVSSSGHLVLGQIFFGITQSQLAFDISVHMGTLLAVLVVYASNISAMLVSVFNFISKAILLKPVAHLFKEDKNLKLAYLILLGSIPTALIGLFLKQFEHILFSSAVLVGTMLILTGTILWVSRNYYFTENKKKGLGIKQALIIGVGQGLAVTPGISRSGTTIALGMFLGLDRNNAAQFSFLLSIPAILGAQILSIKDMINNGLVIDPVTIYATIASFITGLIALKLLLSLVHSGRFHIFAPYCWLIGSLVLLSKFI